MFRKLNTLTNDLCGDPDFNQSVDDLAWRTILFDDLREKMRIADPSGCNGLNDVCWNNFFGGCAVIIEEKPMITPCGGSCMQCWLTRLLR